MLNGRIICRTDLLCAVVNKRSCIYWPLGKKRKHGKGKLFLVLFLILQHAFFFFFLQDINDFLIRERPKDISYEDKKL